MGALVGSLLLFLACVGLVVAMRQRGGLEKDQGGHHYLSTRYCTVLYCTVLYCSVLYCTVLYCTAACCRARVAAGGAL